MGAGASRPPGALADYLADSERQELKLNDQRLKRLPPEVVGLAELKVLEAESNLLKCVPVELCQCTELEKLSLARNKLGTDAKLTPLPDELFRACVQLPLLRSAHTSVDHPLGCVFHIPKMFTYGAAWPRLERYGDRLVCPFGASRDAYALSHGRESVRAQARRVRRVTCAIGVRPWHLCARVESASRYVWV